MGWNAKMEATVVTLAEVRRGGAWHFQPYSRAAREVTAFLEQSHFPVVRLKELVTEIKRGYPMRFSRAVEGIPYLAPGNLTSQGIQLELSKYITPEEHEKLKQTQVHPGDVLVSLIARSPIAAIYAVDRPANISDQLVRLKLKSDIDPAYLVYYLNSQLGQSLVQSHMIGNLLPRLSMNALLELPVMLPPLDEQKQIITEIQQLSQVANQLIREVRERQLEAQYRFDQFLHGGLS